MGHNKLLSQLNYSVISLRKMGCMIIKHTLSDSFRKKHFFKNYIIVRLSSFKYMFSVYQSFVNPHPPLYHRRACWLRLCDRHRQQNVWTQLDGHWITSKLLKERKSGAHKSGSLLHSAKHHFHIIFENTWPSQQVSVYLSVRMIPLAFSFCCRSVELSYWWAHQLDAVKRQSILPPHSLSSHSLSLHSTPDILVFNLRLKRRADQMRGIN